MADVEELWHGLSPPYEDLFAWLEGRSERPSTDHPGRFRPAMLAQAIDEAIDFAKLDPADYAAEWKWDGIRLLLDGAEDIRHLSFRERRTRLEALVAATGSPRIDLSLLQPFASWEDLARLRADPPPGDPRRAEGLMLKRWDSPYLAGRPKGPWFKWKRDPHLIDAVLMYAQRGHGKRSSFYSDYTFGVWREDADGARALIPVGKAYFGFTDAELAQLDKFVRDNTVERFGPVRSVRADRDFGLVLEVAFEGLQRSSRHKSGVAMRFPRVHRIRWDKPAREADELATLERMLEAGAKANSDQLDRRLAPPPPPALAGGPPPPLRG